MEKWKANLLLFSAAREGSVARTQKPLDEGADINAKDDVERTPRWFAQFNGHTKVVELLDKAAEQQQGHAAQVTMGRKDKGPPQVGG